MKATLHYNKVNIMYIFWSVKNNEMYIWSVCFPDVKAALFTWSDLHNQTPYNKKRDLLW